MTRLLFVDDDPHILSGLQRMLRPLRHQWEMAFAQGGQAALEVLAREQFDVIVSDMRMPGITGVQLLSEVSKLYPQTARIILSGQSDQEHLQQLATIRHEYLSKPCDSKQIQEAVHRACLHR